MKEGSSCSISGISSNIRECSLSEIVRGLSDKRFSVAEVAACYLEAIQKNSNLNSFITVDGDRVMDAALTMDNTPLSERGVLLGAPVAVKDNILTKGLKTTAGSRMLGEFVPPYDATVVTRLCGAGGSVLGKTNLDEFAMGSSNENSAFGPVLNPWDLDRVSGGTSGGSAVAVAARLAPAALGTDTGGSVRQPASFCGVLGLKPTYGRMSRYGVVAYASSLDQVGIMAHSVEDIALLFSLLAGHDARDATSSKLSVDRAAFDRFSSGYGEGSVKGLRVGLPREYLVDGLQQDVRDSVMNVVNELQAGGATVVDISLPHTEAAVAVYYIIAPAEASSNLARYDGIRFGHRSKEATSLEEIYRKSRSEGFGPEVKRRILIGTYVLSRGYYDAFYVKAQRVRSLIAQDFSSAFANHCDVILSPVAPTPAFKLREKTEDPLTMYLEDIFTIPTSLAGLPALSIPTGQAGSGLPVGVQVIGSHFREDRLLEVASFLEPRFQWRLRVPSRINTI